MRAARPCSAPGCSRQKPRLLTWWPWQSAALCSSSASGAAFAGWHRSSATTLTRPPGGCAGLASSSPSGPQPSDRRRDMNETSDRCGTWGPGRSPRAAARVALVGAGFGGRSEKAGPRGSADHADRPRHLWRRWWRGRHLLRRCSPRSPRRPGVPLGADTTSVSRYDSDSAHMLADHHRARKPSGKRTEALSGRISLLIPPGPAPPCAPSSRTNHRAHAMRVQPSRRRA